MLDDIHRGYSNALESFTEDFHRGWVAAVQQQRIRGFLGAHGPMIEASNPELCAVVAEHAAALPEDPDTAFEQTWLPELSLLQLAREPAFDDMATGRAAALALALHGIGRTGAWRHRSSEPFDIRFADWLVHDVVAVDVDAAAGAVGLSFRRAGASRDESVTFTGGPARWTVTTGRLEPYPAIDWRGVHIRVMPLRRGQRGPDERVIAADARMVRTLEQGLAVIDETSEAYAEWVARLMRTVVPWRLTPGAFHNASTSSCSGCVLMTVHDDVMRVAETFVHEVTHQYFDVIETMGDVVRGDDRRGYWSPPRQELRPIRNILVAYHAFVNVLVFYQLRVLSGLTLDSDFGRTVEQLSAWQKEMEAHFGSSGDLTPLGELLWRRLSERVALLELCAA